MSVSLKNIGGLGSEIVASLRAAGIRNSDKLLELASTAKGRKALAEKTGIDEKRLLRFANMADRLRVKGLGTEYAELLRVVGVDTVRELKQRNPRNLAREMRKVNDKRKLVRLVPTEKAVGRWIEHARKLAPKITY